MQSYKQRTIPITVTSTLAALLIMLIAAISPAQAAIVSRCTGFNDLAKDTTFNVPASFTSNGIVMRTSPFTFSDGTTTAAGFAKIVDSSQAGAVPLELQVNNIMVGVDIAASTALTPVHGIVFKFGEYGGNLNIRVNGDFRNFANFADIDGAVIGGANVNVIGGNGNDSGQVAVRGRIATFAVGGQELWIDELCLGKSLDNPNDDPGQGNEPRPGDLGDAPDSSNHLGLLNLAYPGVPARFPTVWRGLAPAGPIHFHPGLVWLGAEVSRELEADLGPDEDGVNNILAGGGDNANNDGKDDGWLNPNVAIQHCQEAELKVRVSKNATSLKTAYLNVWIDGNHDGKWGDVIGCQDQANSVAHEWLVWNFPVDVSTILTGSSVDLNVLTKLAFNNTPNLAHWLRFTLSERPLPEPTAGSPTPMQDGRGRNWPNGWETGETEDYLQGTQDIPQPDVVIEKGILDLDGGAPVVVNEIDALPGMPVVFHFRATNKSNSPVAVYLRDRLPEGMVAAEGEVVERRMVIQANSIATSTVAVRILGSEVEERVLVNRAGYVSCPVLPSDTQRPIVACQWPLNDNVKRTNPVTVTLVAPDMGDAPDSSNHFAKPMSTYGGAIAANFPTVFDPATGLPQGPRHRFAPFLHLGERVSAERGADVPPDNDIITNLVPLLNQADNDRFDDGIRPGNLSFSDCKTTTIPVAVAISPRAAAALSMTQGMGYINIWVDANRDGDWADVQECIEAGQNPKQAPEHIVIDFPVNVGALGVGMHLVNVNSNLVPWPAAAASRASWVRVTLSDRPSSKTLGGGTYGDGSGYAEPFRTGETEDYLWRAPNDPANGADVTIHKKGEIAPHHQGNSDTIRWVIEYANLGNSDASNVFIKDEAALAGDLTGLRIRTVPTLPYTIEGTIVTFNVGNLPAGARGHILVQTGIPTGTQQGTAFTNTVGITATNDVNPNNNRAQAVSDIGVRAAIIIAPGDGTTCEDTFAVTGLALPNSEVDLYVDGTKVGTVTAGGLGRWSMMVGPLSDGAHALYAVARKGGFTSNPSRTVTVIVDSTLSWSPLSLRFTDSHGLSRRPVDTEGRTDVDGWGIQLRRNETYTVSVKVCCDNPVSVNMIISDTINVPMTDDDGNKVYEGSFTTPDGRIKESFKLVVVCEDGESTGSGTVLIDPEGQVYDVKTGALLSQASVVCMEQQTLTSAQGTSTTFAQWQADAYGQINPQATLADGHFSFFTPVGVYQLNVNRNGYQPYRSAEIAVVDEAVHYDVPLTPIIDKAANYMVTVSENGFEPAYLEVAPGSVVEWVNVDNAGHSSTLAKQLSTQTSAAGADVVGEYVWDSGLLNSGDSYKFEMSTAGTYNYSDRSNSSNTATIVVKDANATGTLKVFLPVVTK